jgi:shikimate kinase
MKQPVVITGFMAAGKTTLALALAELLNCAAIDLDQLIIEEDKRTPQDLIEQVGLDAFREIETRRLRQALSLKFDHVIALGGGAWTLPRNREVIASHNAFTVWLDAPFELCWQRITEGEQNRPLASTREQAQRLYEERLPAYALASFHLVADGTRDVKELATIIAISL